MPIENLQLKRTNITIVYREFNFGLVSLDKLTRIFPGEPQPIVTSFPAEVLVSRYPNGVLFQLLDRRLRLDDHSPNLSRSPLPTILGPVVTAAGQTDLVAYGYNYDVVFGLTGVDNSGAFLVDTFLKSPSGIEGKLNGTLGRIKLELIYDVEDSRYSLRLEPPNSDNVLRAHLNVHYADKELVTDEDSLGKSLSHHYERLHRSLNELFA